MNLTQAILWLLRHQTPEVRALFSDTHMGLADLSNMPPHQQISAFSRGSVLQMLNMPHLPFVALRWRVMCSEMVQVQQFIQLHGAGTAILYDNGKPIETLVAGQMGVNLLNHDNTQFVRNTTRLDLERLENGSLKIIPLIENAFVGVATISGKRTMQIKQGQVYTISFEYLGDVDNFSYCYLVSRNNGTFHLGKYSVESAIDEPKFFSCTFDAPWTADDLGLLIGFQNTKNQSVIVDNVRFEIGSKRRETVNAEPLDVSFALQQGKHELVWLLDTAHANLQIWGDFIDDVRIQAA